MCNSTIHKCIFSFVVFFPFLKKTSGDVKNLLLYKKNAKLKTNALLPALYSWNSDLHYCRCTTVYLGAVLLVNWSPEDGPVSTGELRYNRMTALSKILDISPGLPFLGGRTTPQGSFSRGGGGGMGLGWAWVFFKQASSGVAAGFVRLNLA
jgi:hypothetical protein